MADLADRVRELTRATIEIMADYAGDGGMGVDDLLELLGEIRLLKVNVSNLEGFVEAEGVQKWASMGLPKLYDGWAVKSGSRRVIREHESLLSVIAKASGLTMGLEGEWSHDDGELVAEVTHAIAQCLPATVAWKVTVLREKGIEPDDFSEWERGRKRLVYEPVEEAE